MSHYIAIQKSLHQQAGFKANPSFSFAAEDTVAPILWEEVAHILPYIPIAFLPKPNKDGFLLTALQGLQPNQNLLIHPSGKWLIGYIPAQYRGYPFALIPEENSDRLHLCIDMDSGLLCEQLDSDCQAFFDDQGEPSDVVKRTMQFLEMCQAGRTQTQLAVDALAEHELLVPWNIVLKVSDEQTLPLQGLYKIDEKKLKQLSAESVHNLNQRGALSLAYAQLLSEHQLKNLQKLYRLHNQQQNLSEEVDLDKLFGEDDDSLKF
ncbi:MAG: SapC family protein [Thiomicrospira sp.]|jgi:hypothetical protein|nr:SapC family protein [Thiomicrospira sp.]